MIGKPRPDGAPGGQEGKVSRRNAVTLNLTAGLISSYAPRRAEKYLTHAKGRDPLEDPGPIVSLAKA